MAKAERACVGSTIMLGVTVSSQTAKILNKDVMAPTRVILLQQQKIHDSLILSTILADAKRVKKYALALALAFFQLVGVDVDRELWIHLFQFVDIAYAGRKIDTLCLDISTIASVVTLSVRI